MIIRMLRDLVGGAGQSRAVTLPQGDRPAVLNVGGGSKRIPISPHFGGWEQHLLDIDPKSGAEIICDARRMPEYVMAGVYDAVYCSHNLEHYHRHEVPVVLRGFLHALKPEGFAEIRVPDIGSLIQLMVEKKLDFEDDIYVSPSGPIMAHDMIWGWGKEIEASGQPWYAHKCGFSRETLPRVVLASGFAEIYFNPPIGVLELHILAFKQPASAEQKKRFGLGG